WDPAVLVWSYLDLYEHCREDDCDAMADDPGFWFYHAPLGVEADVFKPLTEGTCESCADPTDDCDGGPWCPCACHDCNGVSKRTYTIATSGLSWLTESVRECVVAAQRAATKALPAWIFHLGEQLSREDDGVRCASGITDRQLADVYSQCRFVSGLRRIEGFELPAVEGLLCGARPVLFDTPGYRWIYGDWAEYIREESRESVIEQLVELFKRGARPVTAE